MEQCRKVSWKLVTVVFELSAKVCAYSCDVPTTLGGGGAQTRSLSVEKNEKITRTEPMQKFNSTQVSFKLFFSMMDIKNVNKYGARSRTGMVWNKVQIATMNRILGCYFILSIKNKKYPILFAFMSTCPLWSN